MTARKDSFESAVILIALLVLAYCVAKAPARNSAILDQYYAAEAAGYPTP